MTKDTPKTIEKFREEFGIHFKDSPSELQFAEAFIEEALTEHGEQVRQEERDRAVRYVQMTQTGVAQYDDRRVNLHMEKLLQTLSQDHES